jgi:hypothetical protein
MFMDTLSNQTKEPYQKKKNKTKANKTHILDKTLKFEVPRLYLPSKENVKQIIYLFIYTYII